MSSQDVAMQDVNLQESDTIPPESEWDDTPVVQRSHTQGFKQRWIDWYGRFKLGDKPERILFTRGVAACVVVLALAAIAVVVFAALSLAAVGVAGSSDPLFGNRLPPTIVPKHYNLTLAPDLQSFVFTGQVKIDIQASEPTCKVVLHCGNGLDILDASIYVRGMWHTARVVWNTTYQEILLDICDALPYSSRLSGTQPIDPTFDNGQAVLALAFAGTLGDTLQGFYRSSYLQEGVRKYLATTHFEPADARRAFPCFDEPAMKAEFSVTLVTETGLVALSNMPAVSTETSSQLAVTRFATSVKMSTYLVAFIVGDLESIQGTMRLDPQLMTAVEDCSGDVSNRDPLLVRVWAPRVGGDSSSTVPGVAVTGAFALNDAINIIRAYTKYFACAYPLPKIDLVAVPDFSAGAMENWGLITFRETALLLDPQHTSLSNTQRVSGVIAHELAHQWFGNFVTMAWWDDLWLNEGFASYMEYLGMDAVHPEWKVWDSFLASDYVRALKADGKATSHPISMPVVTPSDANAMFDSISYNKGASLLRMLQTYMDDCSPQSFRAGIRHYLQVNAFSNARSDDLWQALQDVSGIDVPHMMDAWTHQTGYPVISMQITREAPAACAATQRPFHCYPPEIAGNVEACEGLISWWVPFNFIVSTPLSTTLVKNAFDVSSSGDIALPSPFSEQSWVKVNANQTGFYRVQYEMDDWKRLEEALAPPCILGPLDKAGLVDDIFSIALQLSSNSLSPPLASLASEMQLQALSMLPRLTNDSSLVTWRVWISNVDRARVLLRRQTCFAAFDAWIESLIRTKVRQIGWPAQGSADDSIEDILLRERLLSLAGSVGGPASEVVQAALGVFSAIVSDPTSSNIDPSVRTMVFSVAVRELGAPAYDWVLARYQNTSSQIEQRRCMHALASATDSSLITRTLDLALDETIVRPQDTTILMAYVSWNVNNGQELLWAYLKEHWMTLDNRYGSGHFAIEGLIEDACAGFDTQSRYDEVQDFFASHPVNDPRVVSRVLESIQSHIYWLSVNADDVCAWIAEKL